MPAGGPSSSCGAAATRSRPEPRRSCAASSPSACSDCRGRAEVDASFTPEQDELRAQARAFLESNPEPSWAKLAELGWTGVSVPEALGGAGLGFLEQAVLHEELGRALAPGPFYSTMAVMLPALPEKEQARVAAGETSWVLALGPLVPDLGTAEQIAIVGGDGVYELVGAAREVLDTADESGPLGVVVGGEAGERLAAAGVLPRDPPAVAGRAGARGVRCRPPGTRAHDRVRLTPRAVRTRCRRLSGRRASAGHQLHGARALTIARDLGRVVRRHERRSRAEWRPLRRKRRRQTPPSRPASVRFRRTGASASPGSTRCTGSTSARCGSGRGKLPGNNCGPRWRRTCSTEESEMHTRRRRPPCRA